MKLNELIARCAALPWRVKLARQHHFEEPHKAAILGPKHPDEGDYAPIAKADDEEAMLMTHAVNMLPKLVAALEQLDRGLADLEEIAVRFTKDMGSRYLFRAKRDWIATVLAEANNPEVPQ